MISQAIVPRWLERTSSRALSEAGVLLGGALHLALLAQVSIPLPFTPVPITGQTFGVATLALLWGSKRACACFGFYLFEGAIGLPVFAQFKSGTQLGPTAGYLAGMWAACFAVGKLSDLGFAREFKGAFLSCILGSVCVFAFGLVGLSFFVPGADLLRAGLLPFLPGDLIKNTLAAVAVSALSCKSKLP